MHLPGGGESVLLPGIETHLRKVALDVGPFCWLDLLRDCSSPVMIDFNVDDLEHLNISLGELPNWVK